MVGWIDCWMRVAIGGLIGWSSTSADVWPVCRPRDRMEHREGREGGRKEGFASLERADGVGGFAVNESIGQSINQSIEGEVGMTAKTQESGAAAALPSVVTMAACVDSNTHHSTCHLANRKDDTESSDSGPGPEPGSGVRLLGRGRDGEEEK
ncbi:uncharacterized protein J3D65DRAFT_148842 [Phyllosticta citribraziliensis]|uniref:Uncharacterized protein n=1 Tax=Phyllosticta citribraziliensis TaxID=989973 RepID=A0ABR1L4L2_9PEZI